MHAAPRTVKLLILVFPAVIFLIIASFYLIRQARSVTTAFPQILTAEMTNLLGRNVSVGAAQVSRSGIAVFKDIKINEIRPSKEPFLTAAKIEVHFNPNKLMLKSRKPLAAINLVRISDISIHLRRNDKGQWNIGKLLKAAKPSRVPEFRGRIQVNGLNVVLHDSLGTEQPKKVQFNNISGKLDFSAEPLLTYSFSGNNVSPVLTKFNAGGSRNYQDLTTVFSMVYTGADMRWWSQYGKKSSWGKITAGYADGKIQLTLLKNNNPLITGSLVFKNGGLFLYPINENAKDVSGSIDFAGLGVKFNVNGKIRRSLIRCFGSVERQRPVALDISMTSSTVESELTNALISRFWHKDIRSTGKSAFEARIRGVMPDLSVEFNTRTDSVVSYGQKVSNVLLSGVYRKRTLGFNRASFEYKGGSAAVRGIMNTKGRKSMNLEGQFRRIPADAPLLQAKGFSRSIRGTLNGRFFVNGTADKPRIRFLLTPSNITVRGEPISIKMAEGTWRDGRTVILQSLIEAAGGSITASGYAEAGKMFFDANLQAVSLQAIASKYDPTLRGITFGRVEATGPFVSPNVAADLQIYNPEYRGIRYNNASAKVQMSDGKLTIIDFLASSYPAELRAEGGVFFRNGKAVRLKLNADLRKGSASDFAALLKIKQPVSGLIDAKIAASGSTRDLNMEGEVRISNASLRKYAVKDASLQFKHSTVGTQINNFNADSELGTWAGSGNISPDRKIQFNVIGKNIPLAALNSQTQPYAALYGIGSVSGKISGSLQSPIAEGSFLSDDLIVNGVPINNFTASFIWNQDRINVPLAQFEMNGKYSLSSLEIDTAGKAFSGTLNINSAAINDAAKIFRSSQYALQDSELRPLITRFPASVTGVMDLNADIGFTPESSRADIKTEIRDAIIGGVEAGALNLDILLNDDKVKISKLKLIGPEMDVSAEGEISLAGDIRRFDLSARNLNTNLLKQFVKLPPVVGLVNLDISAEGKFDSPHVVGSADIASATVYGRKFDLLSLSRFSIGPSSDNGRTSIELYDIVFSTASYEGQPGLSGRAEGNIPWNWNTRQIFDGEPISFLLEVKNQSSAALAALSADIFNPVQTNGNFSVDLRLQGTPDKWSTFGTMTIRDTTLALRALKTPLTEINGEIVFDGLTALLKSLSGKSSAGGTFKVEGTADLSNIKDAAIQGSIQANGLVIKGENISRVYDERIDANITTQDLTFKGKLNTPLIAGNVSFRDTSLRVRGKSEKPLAPLALPINPFFDIRFNVGPNASLVNPRLAMVISGEGTLQGNLKSPDLSALFRVTRGTFNLPTTRLRIRPGGIMTVNYAPPSKPRVALDLQGRTTAYAVSQLGATQRYEILVDISGSPANPEIEVSSNPPGLSQNRIIGLLGHLDMFTDDSRNALRSDIADVFTAAASPFLFSPIEAAVTEALGLEEFSIEYSPNRPFALYFSTRLGGNFFGSYRRQVGIVNEEYEIGFGYRFSPNFQSILTMDERNIMKLQIAGTRRF